MPDDPTDRDRNDARGANRQAKFASEIDARERPSEAVVRTVAALTNESVLDLDPLYDVVDPEYLDGLFDDAGDGGAFEERRVTFPFDGYRVSVTAEEVVARLDARPPH